MGQLDVVLRGDEAAAGAVGLLDEQRDRDPTRPVAVATFPSTLEEDERELLISMADKADPWRAADYLTAAIAFASPYDQPAAFRHIADR